MHGDERYRCLTYPEKYLRTSFVYKNLVFLPMIHEDGEEVQRRVALQRTCTLEACQIQKTGKKKTITQRSPLIHCSHPVGFQIQKIAYCRFIRLLIIPEMAMRCTAALLRSESAPRRSLPNTENINYSKVQNTLRSLPETYSGLKDTDTVRTQVCNGAE